MTRCLSVLLLVAAIGLTAGAGSPEPVRGPLDYAPVMLNVACGDPVKAACGKVVPKLAAWTARSGLEVRAAASGGALDTAAAVCQGQAAAALVPRDAIAQIGLRPVCLERYDLIGPPLYPLYALLVVRADASFRSVDDLVNRAQPLGRPSTIAAGAVGSAGQVTFDFLLRSHPAWQNPVVVTNDGAATALERLTDGSIDGFFTMESLDSELIDRIRLIADARGKPRYAFADVRPGEDFFRAGGGGHCLYRLTALDFGGTSAVTTVSTDAVMMLGRAFDDVHARSGPHAPDALASAIDATQAAILADTKSPANWRPAGTLCQ